MFKAMLHITEAIRHFVAIMDLFAIARELIFGMTELAKFTISTKSSKYSKVISTEQADLAASLMGFLVLANDNNIEVIGSINNITEVDFVIISATDNNFTKDSVKSTKITNFMPRVGFVDRFKVVTPNMYFVVYYIAIVAEDSFIILYLNN